MTNTTRKGLSILFFLSAFLTPTTGKTQYNPCKDGFANCYRVDDLSLTRQNLVFIGPARINCCRAPDGYSCEYCHTPEDLNKLCNKTYKECNDNCNYHNKAFCL